jgi:MoaA/NifB/PqqE/SkfB family radical SAM enzyme
MGILQHIPPSVRGAVRDLLPERVVEAARESLLRRTHFKSMVSRDSRTSRWFRLNVLRQRPRLYHFEIHITDHCNLNCKGCAHFSNLCEPTFTNLTEYEADIRAMSGIFSAVDQIYLLGGEPLLHPDVASFVRVARCVFPNSRIYLMTNGILVTRMDDEFWRALAGSRVVLLCDSYPIRLPIDEIEGLGERFGVTVEWTISRREFFKIPIDANGGHDPARSFKRCQGFNNCPIVRDGRLYPCAYVAFADVFRERFGIEGLRVDGRDWVSIREHPDPAEVMKFLTRPVPWCENCDMEHRELFEWGVSKGVIDEWTIVGPSPSAK